MSLVSYPRLSKKQPFNWREGGSYYVKGSPVEKGPWQCYCQVARLTTGWRPCHAFVRGTGPPALCRLRQTGHWYLWNKSSL